MRIKAHVFAATTFVLLPSVVVAGEPRTTRVETRPFYGATVTLEEGVRVFRPLPPHERVIINPGGRTPLTINVDEHRQYRAAPRHGVPVPRD